MIGYEEYLNKREQSLQYYEQKYCFYCLSSCEKPDTGELRLVTYDRNTAEEYQDFCRAHNKIIREKDLGRFEANSSYWALVNPEEVIVSWGWLAWKQPFYIKEVDTDFDMKDSKTALLYDFHTHSAHRGTGYYGILLRSMVSSFKEAENFVIYARRNNPASCRGIEKAGFHYVGEFSREEGTLVPYLEQEGFSEITHRIPSDPLLSVIVPVYNAEKTIGRLIESVLSQSLTALELILVDDGSTDSSREIISEYHEKDRRVKLITQENQYAGAARNNGLHHASGIFAHFLDADDEVLPYAYECLVRKAIRFDTDVLRFGAVAIDEEGKTRSGYSMDGTSFHEFLRYLDPKKDETLFQISVTPWTGIYRRKFLVEHEIAFNHLYCVNDRSFYIRCITTAKKILVSSDKAVLHHVGMSTSLIGKRAEHFDCQRASLDIVHDQMVKDQIDERVFEKVMRFEFNDLLSWCRKLSGDKVKELALKAVEDYTEKYPYLKEIGEEIKKVLEEGTGIKSAPNYHQYFFEAEEKPRYSFYLSFSSDEETINKILDSIQKQPEKSWEILIHDNCSVDGTEAVIREYMSLDKRIRFLDSLDVSEIKGEYFNIIRTYDEYDWNVLDGTLKEEMVSLRGDRRVFIRKDLLGEGNMREAYFRALRKVEKKSFWKRLFGKRG